MRKGEEGRQGRGAAAEGEVERGGGGDGGGTHFDRGSRPTECPREGAEGRRGGGGTENLQTLKVRAARPRFRDSERRGEGGGTGLRARRGDEAHAGSAPDHALFAAGMFSVEEYCAVETVRSADNSVCIARARTEKPRRQIDDDVKVPVATEGGGDDGGGELAAGEAGGAMGGR